MTAALESCLDELAGRSIRLCVALSGGRDSVALLKLAFDLAPRHGFTLSALHVDHGLSPHSGRWARFCSDLCAGLGVPLEIVRVKVERVPGEGLEAAARRARYRAFARLGAEVDALALAHHAGDQAETMLFRLFRGTGLHGAAGMPACRTLKRDPARPGSPLLLLRPMLEVAPAELDAYVSRHGLAFVDDESNADTGYSRNFLRHEVLAPVDRRFRGAGQRLAAAARRFREASCLLDEFALSDLATCNGERGIAVARLGLLSPARQRNLLAFWLRQHGAAVASESWIEEARRQLLRGRVDAQVRISAGNCEVRTWRGEALLVAHAECLASGVIPWNGEGVTAWAGGEIRWTAALGAGIAADRLVAGQSFLRCRGGGEQIRLDPRRPRRTLKNLLREMDVPPWERERLPCLWSGGDLVWVALVGVDADYAAQAGEPGWVASWVPLPQRAAADGAGDSA